MPRDPVEIVAIAVPLLAEAVVTVLCIGIVIFVCRVFCGA